MRYTWTLIAPIEALPTNLDTGPERAEFDKLRNTFNERIAALLASREEFDTQCGTLEAAAQSDPVKAEEMARGRAGRLLTILKTELLLREKMAAELFPKLQRQRRGYAEAASKAHEQAKEELTEGLLELGYTNDDPQIPGWITPDMYQRNPRVRAAKMEAESAANRIHEPHEHLANEAVLEKLRPEVQERMAKLTARLTAV